LTHDLDAGDPLPSLDGHYPASSLLRRSPPQLAASVLSASDCRPCACRVAPGSLTPRPSQIQDLTLSRHPARATHRRLPPSIEKLGSSGFPLTRDLDAGDPLPLLDGHYPASSLLRRSPPQLAASVLSASDCRPCAFSLNIGKLVPTVPRRSLHPIHAPYAPAAVRAVNRLPADLSQERETPLVLTTPNANDVSSRVCFRSSLGYSPAQVSP
jgi:hypothetical protein